MRLQPDGPDTNHADENRQAVNVRILLVTGFSLAILGIYASFYPLEVRLAMFSMLATWAAMGTGFIALVLSHRMFAPNLNFWDKSMMLLLAALVTGALVDAEAVKAYIEANAPAAASPAAAP